MLRTHRILTPSLTVALAAISLLGCSSKSPESKERAFWRWFEANEARLFDFERDPERVFGELENELHKIHPDLTFEFGPKGSSSRQLVISANGIKEVFPSVIALCDNAPVLPRWVITKFRPRRRFQNPITFKGLRVSPDDVQFTMEHDGKKAGITLFMAGYEPTQREMYAGVGLLMLEHTLGEFDFGTKVGFIEFKAYSEPSSLPKQPVSVLQETFDRLMLSNSQ